jgi:hypothetical protein
VFNQALDDTGALGQLRIENLLQLMVADVEAPPGGDQCDEENGAGDQKDKFAGQAHS